MNNTNRALNRTILLVLGLILTALGAATVTAAVWPLARGFWTTGLEFTAEWIERLSLSTRIAEATTLSWFAVAVLALLLLIVIFALTVIARLGGGHSASVIRVNAESGGLGSVTITEGFASDALTHSLDGRDEILSSKVSASRVQGGDVLHVSVTPRQSTRPVEVAETVGRLVDNLAALTGRESPTYISIHSGLRAKVSGEGPRVH